MDGECFVHPETGEVLSTQEEWRAALDALEEQLAPIYRVRQVLRAEYAERFPAPEMPPKVRRTDTQEKIARCPRCGGTIPEREEASGGRDASSEDLDSHHT